MSTFIINNQTVSIDELIAVIQENKKLALGEVATKAILACRNYLDETIESTNSPIYGINTGFGSLCNTSISASDLAELQRNLVLSHACGMGDRVPNKVVKRMLLLKILGLTKGYSGVQLKTCLLYTSPSPRD